jgi:hypothetical protein
MAAQQLIARSEGAVVPHRPAGRRSMVAMSAKADTSQMAEAIAKKIQVCACV